MLKTYETLRLVADVAICGSGSLYLQGKQTIKPGDLDISVYQRDMDNIKSVLTRMGYQLIFDFPNNLGFDLIAQYTKDGNKVDLFYMGDNLELIKLHGGDILCLPAENVWAARGYYAGKQSVKSNKQLLDMGYIVKPNVKAVTPTNLPISNYSYQTNNYNTEADKQRELEIETDIIFYYFAKLDAIAAQSKEAYKVAAIYVQGDKTSEGYNVSSAYGQHAEVEAIKNFEAKYGISANGGTMYCTLSGCTQCVKLLTSRNITSKFMIKYTGKL